MESSIRDSKFKEAYLIFKLRYSYQNVLEKVCAFYAHQHHTVLNAAHVDVHWKVCTGARRVHERVRVARVQVAHEVPGAVHKRVHRVRLAVRAGTPALRTAHVQPLARRAPQWARQLFA